MKPLMSKKPIRCRRCQKKRLSALGIKVWVDVHSVWWGYAVIELPTPICRQCVKEIKEFWESVYPKGKVKSE